MANALYPNFLDLLGEEGIDMLNDDIRVMLIDTGSYTYSAAHDYLDDVPGGAIVATVALSSLTWVDGTFDSADPTFTSVSGPTSEALILYSHTGGSDAARPLIGYFDTGISGLPITPNGGNITVTVNASGWFSLNNS